LSFWSIFSSTSACSYFKACLTVSRMWLLWRLSAASTASLRKRGGLLQLLIL
jgi:hypothetical protein